MIWIEGDMFDRIDVMTELVCVLELETWSKQMKLRKKMDPTWAMSSR